jgi:ATP-dependent Clp protease ATP-binding subunit ClpC
MLERLTEDSRRALFLARATAREAGRDSIEPVHLLEGLLRATPAGVSADWRAGRAVEPISEHTAVLKVGPSERTPDEIPFSFAVQRALNEAAVEADRLGHRRILPEHLLLAILRESDSVVAQVLRDAGLELRALADRLRSRPQ